LAVGAVTSTGVISSSAGISGSAVSGSHVYATWITASSTISASSFHGDGSQLIGVSSGPAALATGSARLSFATGTGILTLSGSITASNGITGSAFKADGVISAGTLTASGDIYGNLNQANPGQSDTYVLFQQDGTVGGTNEFNFDGDFGSTGRLQVGSSGFQTELTGNLIVSGAGGMGNDLLLNVMGRDSGSILYVSGSGKVGINTATPTHTLTVVSGAISGSTIYTTTLRASGINLSPSTGSKAGPTSYLVLDAQNNLVLTAGGEAGPAGAGSIFTTPNGSTAFTTSSVQIGGSGTPTHPLEVVGLISASAGLTGSALKVAGAISGSIIYGDGSQLIGVSSGPASLASGSAKLNFDTSGGELSGSGPLKIGGAARFASTLAVTGNVSTQGNLSASGQLQLAKAAGHGVYIDGSQVLSQTSLGSTVLGSSLTSVGTLGSLSVGTVTSTGVVSSSADGRFLALDLDSTANVLTKTTLGSSVVNSSLTSVGTLVGVTSSSPIYANAGLNAAGHVSASGDLSARQISAHGEIAITGTHDLRLDYGGEGDSGIYMGASRVLTRTDLGSTVLASSLTSVGTLVGLTSSSPVVANGGVKATTVSASTSVLGANVTPYLAQQILNPSSNYALFEITYSTDTTYRVVWSLGNTSTTDPVVTFVAPASGKVMVDLQHYLDDTSTSGAGPYIYACLSTSTAASIDNDDASIVTGLERIIWYADESDRGVQSYSFLVESLTPGASYTYYPFFRRNSSTNDNRIVAGYNYPLFQMSVRAILETADIYNS
jgi:hypothetical protein